MSSGSLLLMRDSVAAAVREADGSSGRAGGVRKCGIRHGGINGREERQSYPGICRW